MTSIGSSAFYGCSLLTSITIPDSVTGIGRYAFYDTAYYHNTSNWEDRVLYIGNYLIEAKTSISGKYTIKNDTIQIASYAFYKCTSLTSVTIPDSVTSIGSVAFYGCTSLTSVTIPDSVTSIGNEAFYNCSSLKSVTFANTSGWYISTSSTATSGTSVTVTNASTNATYLKSTYYNYYWKRS